MPMKKGFTLIELLVVIALIGILSAVAFASYTTAQTKARDADRKSDLDALFKALELMKSDVSAGTYPTCDTGTSCTLSATSTAPDITASYIKTVPTDPKTGTALYNYTYTPGTGTTPSFTVSACLENSNEAVGGNVTAVLVTVCPQLRQYTVTSP